MKTDKPWQKNGSKQLLQTRLFSIHEEKLVCPRNGKEGNFLVFQFGDWVNVIAITKKNEIVMIKQFRHGNKRSELEIPGGLIDNSDRDPVSAGLRELLEETGYSGKKAELIASVYPNPALQNNLCHTILVSDAEKTNGKALEDCEDIETVLVSEESIEDMIADGLIAHSLVLNALQIYLLKKKRGLIK